MLLKKRIVKIIECFLSDYSKRLTGSEIARKKGLNQKTVSTALIELEKEKILKSITQGKNKLYFISDNPKIDRFLIAIENLRAYNFLNKSPKDYPKIIKGDILIEPMAIISRRESYDIRVISPDEFKPEDNTIVIKGVEEYVKLMLKKR